ESEFQTRVVAFVRTLQYVLSKDAGAFYERRIVQQRERLLGTVGNVAGADGFFASRSVEVREHRLEKRSLPMSVNSAAVLAFVFVGIIVAIGELNVRVVAGGLIREGAR